MRDWHMLTLVGVDRPGIVARVTDTLYRVGCNLGEASMLRLGGNFTISMMVEHAGGAHSLAERLEPVARALDLHLHVDPIRGALHRHVVPDVRVRVHGADRPGIVARVTGALAEAGLDITDLESDVAGTGERPVYVLQIEGVAQRGIDSLRAALERLGDGVETSLEPVDTVLG
ncbi:glycine cleavage system transcriptional repressor [bacterium BMS3Bbin12]|nr:glycine cleavage system transcriptional repressor [bacterium BMS3Abin12]GBE47149.1 glycine cleavage system transcriptional repressor [bacterium BMS3Bbin12]GBE49548.1 glycine cleavage system transcriptional repressor [bacterium BMS3Bbin13]